VTSDNTFFPFVIRGKADAAEYAKDPATSHNVGGHVVYLNDAPVAMTSKMQRLVAIPVTEAELIEICECALDRYYL
jgi:hypothetical protein